MWIFCWEHSVNPPVPVESLHCKGGGCGGGGAERGTGLCGGSLNPWPKEGSTPQTVASRRKIQFQTLFCEYSRASGSVHDKSIGKFQLWFPVYCLTLMYYDAPEQWLRWLWRVDAPAPPPDQTWLQTSVRESCGAQPYIDPLGGGGAAGAWQQGADKSRGRGRQHHQPPLNPPAKLSLFWLIRRLPSFDDRAGRWTRLDSDIQPSDIQPRDIQPNQTSSRVFFFTTKILYLGPNFIIFVPKFCI